MLPYRCGINQLSQAIFRFFFFCIIILFRLPACPSQIQTVSGSVIGSLVRFSIAAAAVDIHKKWILIGRPQRVFFPGFHFNITKWPQILFTKSRRPISYYLFIYFFLKFLWSPFIHHPTLIRMFFPSYISSTHREMVGFQNCWMGVFIPCSFILKLEPWIAADYTVFLHKKVGRKRSSHANERTEWNKHADAHRTHTHKK